MSELTRIITIQITKISNAENAPEKEAASHFVSYAVKKCLDADDVNVLNVQDFINDEK